MNRGRITKLNRGRVWQAMVIIMALLLGLIFRLAWIQVVRADEYTNKAINQQTSDIPIEASRGNILDSRGTELATSVTVYSVWIRPSDIRNSFDDNNSDKLNAFVEKLAVILDKKSDDLLENVNSKKTLIKIAKYLDKDTCDKVKELVKEEGVSGVETVEGTKRYYPQGTMAAQLLGSVTDDNTGRTGVEYQFDNYLSGVPGRWVKETDVNGNLLSNGSKKYYAAKDGENVVLTIDTILQNYLEKAVKKGMKKTKSDKIMAIAMNPKTGDILAMVTNPSYDPNDPMEPSSDSAKSAFKKMDSKEQAEYLNQMWRNPLVSDLYEPGSTFKLVTTSAALEEGVTSLNEKFVCGGSKVIEGTRLYCWNQAGHGKENLKEALGNSCNPVQMELVKRLGTDKYYNYLELFGITEKTGVDLPAESSAIIKDPSKLGLVDFATMSYGQGIALTPLQLVTAVSSIGNDGYMMKPRIVKELQDDNGKTVKTFKTEKVRQVMSSKTADEMKKIMEYVVSDGGASTAQVKGYRVGGKTGTANQANSSGGYSNKYWSSFIGMAPMEDPEITVLVVCDNPKSGNHHGSATAGPIVKDFLTNALPYLGASSTSK